MYFVGPGQNALEGALAALCAIVAMVLLVLVALTLAGASSVGSLWSLTMAVTAMAVGGSVSLGSDSSGGTGGMGGMGGMASLFGGGGSMSPSISGAASAVPLSVTLVGAVVLWIGFSWRLRQGQQRRFNAGELTVRAAGAASMALFTLMIVAGLGSGSAKLSASAMKGMGGSGMPSGGSGSGGSNPFSQLMGGSGGSNPFGGASGGTGSSATAVSYHVSAFTAGFGALVWVAVALGVGCLISRRARLPLGGTLDRLRPTWAPSLSALVRTLVVIAAIPLVALVVIGAVVGGRAGTAAGAALLLAPNLIAAFFSLGVGSGWTAAMHPVQSDSSSNPLAGMMGGMGGTGGKSGATGAMQSDRTEHLRSLAAGGWPLWLLALAVTALILVACAYRASRVTHPAHTAPLHRYQGPLARHLGMAERFAVVTAVVLGLAAWLGSVSGNFAISMFGSEMGGMRAELNGSVLGTIVFGLVVGALCGFAGSLLSGLRGQKKAAA